MSRVFLGLFILSNFLIVSSCKEFLSPNCGSEDVKEIVLELFKEKYEDKIIANYYEENINYNDIRAYARTNGLAYREVLEREKEKMKGDVKFYLLKVYTDLKFEKTLTNKIQEEIDRCDCSTTLSGNYLNDISVEYFVQITEEDRLYVEALFSIAD